MNDIQGRTFRLCNFATLQIFQHYNITTLQHYNITTLQLCKLTILLITPNSIDFQRVFSTKFHLELLKSSQSE
jgi:hypothetical protein